MVTALDVARLFLNWSYKNGDLITNLRIQKLLYYAQAWYLVNYNRRLFNDPIEAWDLGPVIRSVYKKYKKYGGEPIPYKTNNKEETVFQPHQIHFLGEYFKIYSNLSATALVSLSHSETPWKNAHKRGKNSEINTQEMKAFYANQYKEKYG